MSLLPGRRVSMPDLTAVTIPVWTPDDRGAALFHGVANGNAANAANLGSGVRIDARGEGFWHGWTRAPQVVMSTGRLGGGRPIAEEGSTIDDERGIASNPVQRIFEERMAARRFS